MGLIQFLIATIFFIPMILQIRSNECDEKILDDAGKQIIYFTDKNFVYPTNEEEMAKQCEIWEESITNVTNFSAKCHNSLTRQVLRLLMFGASRNLDEVCSKNGTTEALKYYPCISEHKDVIRNCTSEVITRLYLIVEKLKGLDRIVPGCCVFKDYSNCAYNAMLNLCSEKEANYVKYLEDGYTSDLWELACLGFDITEEKCDEVRIPITQLKEHRLTVFLPHLIQVFLDLQ